MKGSEEAHLPLPCVCACKYMPTYVLSVTRQGSEEGEPLGISSCVSFLRNINQ